MALSWRHEEAEILDTAEVAVADVARLIGVGGCVIGFDAPMAGDYWIGSTRWMCRLPPVVSSRSCMGLSDGGRRRAVVRW
jgi:hypothetical protein